MTDKFAGLMEKANVYAQRILALPNDSFEKTVAVAFGLCLVGAVLVSGSAVILKPLQESNKADGREGQHPGSRRHAGREDRRRRGLQEVRAQDRRPRDR